MYHSILKKECLPIHKEIYLQIDDFAWHIFLFTSEKIKPDFALIKSSWTECGAAICLFEMKHVAAASQISSRPSHQLTLENLKFCSNPHLLLSHKVCFFFSLDFQMDSKVQQGQKLNIKWNHEFNDINDTFFKNDLYL